MNMVNQFSAAVKNAEQQVRVPRWARMKSIATVSAIVCISLFLMISRMAESAYARAALVSPLANKHSQTTAALLPENDVRTVKIIAGCSKTVDGLTILLQSVAGDGDRHWATVDWSIKATGESGEGLRLKSPGTFSSGWKEVGTQQKYRLRLISAGAGTGTFEVQKLD